MEKLIKQEDINHQQMDQNHPSNKSFTSTSHTYHPLSLQYLDAENKPSLPVKIQNDNSEPIQREPQFHSDSEHSVPQALTNKSSSAYHNFQKHLITTLRLHVNFSNYRRSNSTADCLMVELWEYFLKSAKPTKKYLYSLLMNIPENIIQFKNKYSEKGHKQEFERIITEASPEDLSKAQNNLRIYLMRQCKRLVENGHLNHRRINKIEQFKEYFNTFINDLETGSLNLRLPKPNLKPNKTQSKQSKQRRAAKNRRNTTQRKQEQ